MNHRCTPAVAMRLSRWSPIRSDRKVPATNVILLSSSFLGSCSGGAQRRGNIDDDFKRVLRDWASSKKDEIVGTLRPAYEGSAIETICERSALVVGLLLDSGQSDQLAPVVELRGRYADLARSPQAGRLRPTATEESPPDQCPKHRSGRTDPLNRSL